MRIKNFNDFIGENMNNWHNRKNEKSDDDSIMEVIRGSEVMNIEDNGTFKLETNNGTLKVACSGGNSISLGRPYTNLRDLKGSTIIDIQVIDSYTVYIKFDNIPNQNSPESINVYDDTGGEGIEIWLDKD